jgi:hypothetical protein
MKPIRTALLLLLLTLLFTACSGANIEPQALVEIDETATPTTKPEPTATPTSTPAAAPTLAATSTATAEATPEPAVAVPEMAETCASAEVAELVARLQQAIASENEEDLAALIHPESGLDVRMAWWNPAVHFDGAAAEQLLSDGTSHDWGVEDGSGFAITGSFAEVALPPLQKDLVEASEMGCDEILHGSTAGLVQLPPEDEGMEFVSLHRPAPPDLIEFDWGTWVVGYDDWQGEPRVTTLIYYRYEI